MTSSSYSLVLIEGSLPMGLWWVWGWALFASGGDIGHLSVHRKSWQFVSNCERRIRPRAAWAFHLPLESTNASWVRIVTELQADSRFARFSGASGQLDSCWGSKILRHQKRRCPFFWNSRWQFCGCHRAESWEIWRWEQVDHSRLGGRSAVSGSMHRSYCPPRAAAVILERGGAYWDLLVPKMIL